MPKIGLFLKRFNGLKRALVVEFNLQKIVIYSEIELKRAFKISRIIASKPLWMVLMHLYVFFFDIGRLNDKGKWWGKILRKE